MRESHLNSHKFGSKRWWTLSSEVNCQIASSGYSGTGIGFWHTSTIWLISCLHYLFVYWTPSLHDRLCGICAKGSKQRMAQVSQILIVLTTLVFMVGAWTTVQNEVSHNKSKDSICRIEDSISCNSTDIHDLEAVAHYIGS